MNATISHSTGSTASAPAAFHAGIVPLSIRTLRGSIGTLLRVASPANGFSPIALLQVKLSVGRGGGGAGADGGSGDGEVAGPAAIVGSSAEPSDDVIEVMVDPGGTAGA